MKRRVLFLFVLLFLLVGIVKAEGTAFNTSGFSVSANINNNNDIYMKVTGFTMVGNTARYDNNELSVAYAMFSKTNTKITSCPASFPTPTQYDISAYKTINFTASDDFGKLVIFNDWYALDEYKYVYIYFKIINSGGCYYSENPLTVNKTYSEISVQNRYNVAVDNAGAMSFTPLFPYDKSNDVSPVELTVKIGKITNSSIIAGLKTGNASIYNTLLDYAKNDSSGVPYNNVHNRGSDKLQYSNNTIKADELYYVYTRYSDASYVNTDGINVFQGTSDGKLKASINYDSVKGAVPVDEDDEQPKTPDKPTDGPVENPDTGWFGGIVGMIAFMAVIVALSLTSKKKIYRI